MKPERIQPASMADDKVEPAVRELTLGQCLVRAVVLARRHRAATQDGARRNRLAWVLRAIEAVYALVYTYDLDAEE